MAFVVLACQGLLAVVFLASSVSKLRSGPALRAFSASLIAMRLAGRSRAGSVALAVAVAEAAVPVLLMVPPARKAGFAAAAVLLVALTAAVAVVLARGTAQPCRCFGGSAAPLAGRHLVRNLVLLAGALAGLAGLAGLVAPAPSPPPEGSIVALCAGGLAGVLVTVLDDLIELFVPASTSPRRPDGVPGRGRGPDRPAGRPQPAVHRRRDTPAA
ncbi:MauE/DoxX family redox-associated membrane protein [Thermoactinospora rubra]|uniref:MauE/DoxX family redox-associated membrane protein n=1 Tax=Thermoactinospora rubra TaxID=1088767 RepID=UPI000A121590|nr:MauE/DoxX family redox-associated membrane protein [Thermoactinospora rubra]